jgi:hypothetical protein
MAPSETYPLQPNAGLPAKSRQWQPPKCTRALGASQTLTGPQPGGTELNGSNQHVSQYFYYQGMDFAPSDISPGHDLHPAS